MSTEDTEADDSDQSEGEADSKRTVFGTLVPSFVRSSYRAKFVLTILAVVVVISAVGAAGYVNAEQTVQDDTEQQLTAMVDMHADSINQWTISMEAHTRSLSSSPDLAGTSQETAQAHVIQEQAKLPVDVRAIHIVDTNENQVLTSTNLDIRGESLGGIDEPWTDIDLGVDLTSANDVWKSPTAYNDQIVDDQVMSFASPIEGDEARIAVVVGTIEYRVDGLRQLHDDQETLIVDTENRTVLGSSELSGDFDQGVVSELGTRRNGEQFTQDSGTVTAYAALPDNNWVAVSTAPTSQAFAASDAVGLTLVVVIAAGLLSLLVAGFVLARQTVTPLRDLRDKAEKIEQGDRSVELETNRVDEVGRLYQAFDGMRTSLDAQITAAEEAKSEAEEAKEDAEIAKEDAESERERVSEMMNELERVADQYGETMRAAANGDLTVRADVNTDNDQMRTIGEEFNEMLADIEAAVGEVKQFAADVTGASERVTTSTKEVKQASEQVSTSIQEISVATEQQSERLGETQTEMSNLSGTTEEIASTASEVAGVAEQTVESSETGQEAAQNAISEMNKVEKESERAVETIRSLETEVERIDELVDAISDVAEQTNMLALNASIEATRAGEGNNADGFDTVAQEIKALSADAKEAATEIEQRIQTIRDQTEESVQVVETTRDRVQQGTEAVEPAVEALEGITTYAEETNNGVQEISAATDEQAKSAEEVVSAVDDVAASSDESAAEAENVSAAAEEQTASLTEVTDSVASLADQASNLSQRLKRFETNQAD
ncbi:methyl-accepting chemotaxis protein [Halovenus rubra]|uniref:Methyl-accepting chemotaxis protein n=2 Tax=Halovenus rubra TaxID=869890 RepID=A0ABD5X4S6_9EURY|nr:methyl-accepting chemotaxis protein [Halovenus rubra]